MQKKQKENKQKLNFFLNCCIIVTRNKKERVRVKGKIMQKFLFTLRNSAKNEQVFRFSYILCLFLSSLCFIEQTCLALTALNMIWALYFFKERFATKKNIKQICCHTLLLLFLVQYLSYQ